MRMKIMLPSWANALPGIDPTSTQRLNTGMSHFPIELSQESDGRWIAEIATLPGVLCYGKSQDEAIQKVEALALRVIADRIENGEEPARINQTFAFSSM